MDEDTEQVKAVWQWDEDREGLFPFCPVCGGRTENTPSGAVVCLTHGSEHFRRPVDEVYASMPSRG